MHAFPVSSALTSFGQRRHLAIWLTTALITLGQPVVAQQLAFPGAEGAGRFTTGGRGTSATPTTVFEVTNLNDDTNPGSFRYAVSQKSDAAHRTVVFRVSGTIHLNSPLTISKSNTTIAGQTAPGDGICLADYPVSVHANNVVVRFIRFRMGDKNQNKGMIDGAGGDDAFGGTRNNRLIIDHCTMSWSTDETFSVYEGDSTTLQWNLMSEPLNYSYHFEEGDKDFEHHGFGGIWGGQHSSMHHNLFAHCNNRTPRWNGSRYTHPAGFENCDFRNNVIYDWGQNNVYAGEGGNYNMVNNYYKYGPSTNEKVKAQILNPYKLTTGKNPLPYGKFYLTGNYVDGSPAVSRRNWSGVVMNAGTPADTALSKVDKPFDLGPVTTQSAPEAYEAVLQSVGASLPKRDAVDQRIISDVRNRTGGLIDVQGGFPHGTPYSESQKAWPVLSSKPAPTDTDHDGMPDAWETAHKLNPKDAADRSKLGSDGYTMLEAYLNSLATPSGVATKSQPATKRRG
ncbi:pectate lyase family protein [Hymenobacter cavernae]|uniref:pectate lyase family protein n=1 Tax=Hymenobacter cavernae TaxID=2044852 RepID=UPI00166E6040|nr:pectate lyase [Hymenobacter cavernae]